MEGGDFIKVTGLCKRFSKKKKPALDAIDLCFPKGKRIGIVGPDGAGKTTFLRILAGLLLPSSGSVEVGGLDLSKETSKVQKMIGYMPQKFGLYEDLTVMENLSLYADLQGVRKEEKKETFERLLTFSRLHPFTQRLAKNLSGGMKQKLGLSCSLIQKPDLLLLDEPTVGVDPLSRRDLWKMVSDLLQEPMTVLWSTSYLDEAQKCDLVLLLHEGRVLFLGPPGEMTQRLEGRTFLLEHLQEKKRELLSSLFQMQEVMDATVQSSAIRLVLKKEADREKIDVLMEKNEGVISPISPRFEDAFIDLLGGSRFSTGSISTSVYRKEETTSFLIEAKNLTKKFGSFAAVENVSFQVRRGEIFGLLGPNGAGKSTTFRMLCGLLQPTGGIASVSGLSLEIAPSEARGRVGYMAQKFSLYATMTVKQNLRFFSGIYSAGEKGKPSLMNELVEIFGLKPYFHYTTSELPLGFKQRLALSCALMHQPDVLFLDEPTAGVDPLTRREFWMHINHLVQKGMTVMVTTHFMDEAEYCDRIGLILDGKLMNLGTPDELKDLAKSKEMPDPTLEDAFIFLSQKVARAL